MANCRGDKNNLLNEKNPEIAILAGTGVWDGNGGPKRMEKKEHSSLKALKRLRQYLMYRNVSVFTECHLQV